GCGQGGFASLVARDHKYAGFERADDSCEGGDRRVASFPVACIYNAAMTESRTLRAPVGALISSEAPEHLADDRGALKSSLRLFANGRSVVFSAPANS